MILLISVGNYIISMPSHLTSYRIASWAVSNGIKMPPRDVTNHLAELQAELGCLEIFLTSLNMM